MDSPVFPAAIRAPGAAAVLPLAPGVYRFRDQAGRVLYIGRAVSLRRRVQSYWRDLGDRAHLVPMVARIAQVEAVPCDSAHEAAWLERNLLRRRLPPWNRSPGGQEAEVWIRLSDSPRTPGLTVVRRPAPGDFGPYLGGQKTRDAVSGLSRDQDAVAALRADLAARRDAAATALAFEFAAKLQAELEAVDWITAEQKVARGQRDQADADVYGWAGGCPRLLRDPRRPDVRLAAAPLYGRRPPSPRTVRSRLGRLRPAQCRTCGPAQAFPSRNLRWVKLYQLPESSRMTASTP